ncbi:sugar phosphate isomerase/epimerase [Mucilaginibacter sp. UYNi724]
MKILFFCPRWGSENLPWDIFFKKVKDAGYDGVEMGFPPTLTSEERSIIIKGLKQYNLSFIGQHWQTVDQDFHTHLRVYEENLLSLVSGSPLFINSQTGKDHFTVEQNLQLIKLADEISTRTGIPIIHETHRGKWSFAAHITKAYLQQNRAIRITLDISHWCNVAETYLEDQPEAVDLAIKHTDHLHARIGHTEGPQVPDPRDPLWAVALQHHLGWWDRVIKLKRQQGASDFTITPEFGAPPYTTLLPGSHQPIASQWDINAHMMEILRKRYPTIDER